MTEKIKAIQMVGECSIKASLDADGKDKLPTFAMTAYSGGVMNVAGFGKVAISLSGMNLSDRTPILYGHDRHDVDSIMGQSTTVEIKDGKLIASGVIMGESETVKKVTGLARNGYNFQASVGVSPIKASDIDDDMEVEVNGQMLKGPFLFVSESNLDEISIVPLGADKKTESRIAASSAVHNNLKENKMDKKEQKTAEDIRAEAVAEESRMKQIRVEAKDHPEIQARAIKEGWDVSTTQLAVRDSVIADQAKQIEASKVQDDRPKAPEIKVGNLKASALNRKSIEAAVCLNQSMSNPEKQYDSETLNMAQDLRVNSITDLVRASLAMEGKRLEASRHDTREFLQAAFSTRNISNILSNVANKFILQGFGAVESTWREIANVRSVVDFKTNTGNRLVMDNLLKPLSPNGEIQHASLSDETRTIKADTKAIMLGITRQDIVNDDLGALTEIPRKLGFASARTFCTDFWKAFEDAVAANFSADAPKKNQTTGVLSLTTLAAAEALFLALKDADGNPIGAKASKLLCGTTAYTKAREIFVSTAMVGGSTKDTGSNIYTNMFTPVFSAYLSAAPWYLTADPMSIPVMEAAFLNGRQEPFVETSDADFNTLGVQMRCWYDYGVAFGEWRGAVRSTGA